MYPSSHDWKGPGLNEELVSLWIKSFLLHLTREGRKYPKTRTEAWAERHNLQHRTVGPSCDGLQSPKGSLSRASAWIRDSSCPDSSPEATLFILTAFHILSLCKRPPLLIAPQRWASLWVQKASQLSSHWSALPTLWPKGDSGVLSFRGSRQESYVCSNVPGDPLSSAHAPGKETLGKKKKSLRVSIQKNQMEFEKPQLCVIPDTGPPCYVLGGMLVSCGCWN